MTSRQDVLDRFRQLGALLEGHFRLSSGLHSPNYLQCALVLQHPAEAEALGRALGREGPGAWADRRAVARARRPHHRPRGGARARRAGDLRRACGGRAHAAPRVRPRARGSRRHRRGRRDDRRVDARDDGGGQDARRDGGGRGGGDQPERRIGRPGRAAAALADLALPTYQPEALPVVREGTAARQAGIAAAQTSKPAARSTRPGDEPPGAAVDSAQAREVLACM